MRKNKGYDKKHYCAVGENENLEQYIANINKRIDEQINLAKKEYAIITTKTTLVGEDLRKYCNDMFLWEIKFDENLNLIPLEKALEMIEEDRRKCLGYKQYSKCCGYQKRIINKDNQPFVYNTSGGGSNKNTIRVPSLKRSKKTWKRFYELFPTLKGKKTYKGIKLKKI